uniref:Uncharacterized protein n=1 Tax=Prymnesium polylepis TaxID=72548 RepID=A0A6T8AYB6_9EUKA|mmetsp:Transcript_66248/g.181656  ORF Transcript_66248/g.181656 Transcript_66248/m.181656 type:complete len:102 (-) Transcript_66248:2222-2527(-)
MTRPIRSTNPENDNASKTCARYGILHIMSTSRFPSCSWQVKAKLHDTIIQIHMLHITSDDLKDWNARALRDVSRPARAEQANAECSTLNMRPRSMHTRCFT